MGCNSAGAASREKGGKLDPNDIYGERDMITERHTVEGVDEVLAVSKDFTDMYGDAVTLDGFVIADMKQGTGIMGYYDGTNIAMNNEYFSPAEMTTAYDKSVSQGYHPSRGNKTAIQAVAAHEYGHAMTDAVGRAMGSYNLDDTARRIVNEARKGSGFRGIVQMAKSISRYATVSNAEAVAEAFADVYCNGRRATKASQAIVNVCNSYLKR